MSNKKIKIHRNPERSVQEKIDPYVPNYKKMEIQPTQYQSAIVPNPSQVEITSDEVINTRNRIPVVRQEYAPTPKQSLKPSNSLLPNVGNNVEQVWIADESDLDPNQPMIDNNNSFEEKEDFSKVMESILPSHVKLVNQYTENTYHDTSEEVDVTSILHNLSINNYLVIYKDQLVCEGSQEEVETDIQKLMFNEHQLSENDKNPSEFISVIKKCQIKVGVFLE